jgi:c-di-GMP-binding flagellar brake protein YcgR
MKMPNQRKLNRHSLIYQLSVFNYDTEKQIGYIVDISLEGAMLISESPVSVGTQIKLHIVLPPSFPKETYLDIEAESVRVCQDVNTDYYDTGFRFFRINSQQQEIISCLVDEYGF